MCIRDRSRFGPSTTTAGGWALKFYASLRLQMWASGRIEEGTERVGTHVNVRVVKNKVAPPFKEAEFDIVFGRGIDHVGEVVDLGVEAGVIEKSGSWFSYNGERLGQGKENVKEFFGEKPEVLATVEERVRDFFAIPKKAAARTEKAAESE